MKNRIFPLIVALSALLVAGSAAFYSVYGLSKLFAGASIQVMIMAGSLEFAKLVVASLLYQYWDTINKWLRTYLTIACFVLMVITSGGIYGFLSGAYQSTATQSELLDKSLLILEQKQVRFEETKEDLTLEKNQINKSISDLRVSLSNPQQVSWYDKNSETVITSTSSSARRALQAELKTTIVDRENINIKIEAVMDSINKTDLVLLDKEISNEDERELGPLKYLAETTGKDMGQVVNWFLLLIIFVFDPLAIALVVASNMAFAKIKKPEEAVVEEHVDSKPHTEKEFTDEQINSMSTQAGIIEREMGIPITPTELDLKALEKYLETLGSVKEDGKVVTTKEEKHYPGPSDELKKRVKENQDKLKTEEPPTVFEDDYFGDLDRLTDTTQTLIVDGLDEKRLNSKNDDVSLDNGKKVLTYRKRK